MFPSFCFRLPLLNRACLASSCCLFVLAAENVCLLSTCCGVPLLLLRSSIFCFLLSLLFHVFHLMMRSVFNHSIYVVLPLLFYLSLHRSKCWRSSQPFNPCSLPCIASSPLSVCLVLCPVQVLALFSAFILHLPSSPRLPTRLPSFSAIPRHPPPPPTEALFH